MNFLTRRHIPRDAFFYAFFRRFDVENMHRGICVLKQLARGEPLSSAKLLYLRGKREKSTIILSICVYISTRQTIQVLIC